MKLCLMIVHFSGGRDIVLKMVAFSRFDQVFLKVGDVVVATGCVQKVNPDNWCQNVSLGVDRISVLVESAFHPHVQLPIYSPIADTMDSCVLWDTAFVSLVSTKGDHNEGSITPLPGLGPSPEIDMESSWIASHAIFEGDNLNCKVGGFPDVLEIPLESLSRTVSMLGKGDVVHLVHAFSQKVIGKGVVHNMRPGEMCHNIEIGVGNISVRVTDSVKSH